MLEQLDDQTESNADVENEYDQCFDVKVDNDDLIEKYAIAAMLTLLVVVAFVSMLRTATMLNSILIKRLERTALESLLSAKRRIFFK